MSHEALNDEQFGPYFHGTRHRLRKGQLLTPGGGPSSFSRSSGEHVHFTDDPGTAGQWADVAEGPGGTRVYHVQPKGPHEEDPEAEFEGNYRTSHSVRVVKELKEW